MKNNPFTRFLSVALTAAMLVGVMPGAVLADAGEAIVGASSAVVESIPESTTPADAAPVATEVPPVTEPEATPEAVVEPEASPEAEATPEATEEPEATPEATEQPEATPEATQEPEATPEATEQPEATPEATQEPEATPEATEQPEATPEATEEPETSPEPTEEPVELNKEAYIETAEVAEGVTVTVKVPANTLPEDVNLVAEMLAEDTQAHADAEAALAEAEVQYDGMIAMDIRFEDAQGNEVEPANEVEVSIDAQALLPEDADPETVAVQHLKEDATGAVSVETVADAAPATGDVTVAENVEQPALNMASTFAVDGFSTFTIIWQSGLSATGTLTVHYWNVTTNSEFDGPRTNQQGSDKDYGDAVELAGYADVISGYTYQEARADSPSGTVITHVKFNRSGSFGNRKYQWQYSGNGSNYSNWGSQGSDGREVYLLYASESSTPGETSATVTTGKTLTLQNGQQPGGLYDLTLSVSGDKGSIDSPAKVDILLVVDKSGSMAYDLNRESGNNRERMKAVVSAVESLTGALEANDKVDVQYDLITFSSLGYTNSDKNTGWTKDATTINDAVSCFTETDWFDFSHTLAGGTNYQYAFNQAKVALNSSSVRSDATQIVIFLTDGIPTHKGVSREGQDNNNSSYTNTNAATSEMVGLKADQFYCIGIGSVFSSSGNDSPTNGRTNLQKIIDKAKELGIQTTDTPYTTTSSSELEKFFQQIAGSTTFYACQDVTLTDTMSRYAEVVADEKGSYTFTINVKNGDTVEATQTVTLSASETSKTVNLAGVGDVTLAFQNGTITLDFPATYPLEKDHTYTVTTTVKPTQAAIDAGSKGYNDRGDAGTGTHAGQPGFYSNNNESAKVTFKPTVDNKPGEEQSESFPKPVIQVFDPGDVEMDTPAHTKQAILNDDGTYDLTLTVSGSTGTATKKAEVDVLMVVDVSNSMDNYGRLGNTKKAMEALVDTLKANNTVDARYSIVKFSSKNDFSYGNGTAADAELVLDWSGTETEVENGINSLSPWGGTNYQAGLRLAATQLETARPTATTVVVFLSDGNPTYFIGGGSGQGTISGNGWNNTVNEAKTITCSQFYSVSIGEEQAEKMTEISNAVNASIHDSIAVQSDASDLTSKFQEIAGSVTALLCEDVTITDTLSQYAEAVLNVDNQPEKLEVKVTDANGNNVTDTEVAAGNIAASYSVDGEGNEIVKLDFDDNYRLKANYTYSVTLKIKPTEEALTYLAENDGDYPHTPDDNTGTHAPLDGPKEKGFYSNDTATLTYKVTGINQKHEVPYDKPVIQVSKGNLLISKTFTGLSDTEIKALEDTLTFTYTNTADPSDSHTVKLGDMELKDGKYQYLVENLDVNAQYKVTESGYEVADYDRTGSDVEVTVTIASGQTDSADFTNKYTWNPKGSLTINKTLTSFNPSMGDDAAFQFRIEALSGKYQGRVWYRYITFKDEGTDKVVLDKLPVGEYQVTELDSAGYKLAENILQVQKGQITKTAPDAAVNYTNESTGGNIPGDQDIVRNNFRYDADQGCWVFEQQQEQQQP